MDRLEGASNVAFIMTAHKLLSKTESGIFISCVIDLASKGSPFKNLFEPSHEIMVLFLLHKHSSNAHVQPSGGA